MVSCLLSCAQNSGRRIEVRRGFDALTLQRLLAILDKGVRRCSGLGRPRGSMLQPARP